MTLTRQEISDATAGHGWRLVLGELRTVVVLDSRDRLADLVAALVEASGADGGEHLGLDIRPGRVTAILKDPATGRAGPGDLALAARLSGAALALGLRAGPGGEEPVQVLEIAIDALDIPAIRPFWRAALDYRDEPGRPGDDAALIDPRGQGPAVWFQQLDAPRPQRNRLHLDLSVPHELARSRIEAALAAGGTLLGDREAPAFWTLGDAEGNEVCITTWQGRD